MAINKKQLKKIIIKAAAIALVLYTLFYLQMQIFYYPNCSCESIEEAKDYSLLIRTYKLESTSKKIMTSTNEIIEFGTPWMEHQCRAYFDFLKAYEKQKRNEQSSYHLMLPILKLPTNCKIAITPRTKNYETYRYSSSKVLKIEFSNTDRIVLDVHEFEKDSLLASITLEKDGNIR